MRARDDASREGERRQSLLTVLHVGAYYSHVPEVSTDHARLTSAATDLLGIFHGVPRQVAPVPARDMTLGQLRLLFLLQREGAQPMGRIAEIFDLSATASTGFVERVERHGLVERRHRSDDRRVVECTLTAAGGRFLGGLSGMRLDLIRDALSVLDPDDLAEFQRLVRVIRERQGGAA